MYLICVSKNRIWFNNKESYIFHSL